MAEIEKVIKEAEEELEFLAPDEKHRFHMRIMMKLGWIYNVLALLKEQPQIVRCKDCKYGETSKYNSERIYCNLTADPDQGRESHHPDWFCADGTPKDGETT